MTNVVYPSDIKLKITSLKDNEGNTVTPDDVYLLFDIFDQYGSHYTAISDPDGIDTKNTTIVDDVLYIAIENYKLRGELSIKVGIKSEDSTFPDGYQLVYGKCQSLNITIIDC